MTPGHPSALPRLTPLNTCAHVGPVPLSYQQTGWWQAERAGMVGYRSRDGEASANIHAALLIRGRIRVEALAQSAALVMQRHEALRTVFLPGDGQMVQLVTDVCEPSVTVTNAPDANACSRSAPGHQLAADFVLQPFDYSRGPMFRLAIVRLAADEHLVVLAVPHLVADAWSLQICVRELLICYAGRAADLKQDAAPVQYTNFTFWQRRWLQHEVRTTVERYYRDRLATASPPTLPTDRARMSAVGHVAADTPIEVPERLFRAVSDLAWTRRAVPFAVVLAVYAALLARWSHSDTVLLVTPLPGRPQARFSRTVGFCSCFAHLPLDFSRCSSFEQIVDATMMALSEAKAFDGVPHGFLAEIAERLGGPSPPVRVSANFITTDFDAPVQPPDATVTTTFVPLASDGATMMSRYDLNLLLHPARAGGLTGSLRYPVALYAHATIEGFGRYLHASLEHAVSHPGVAWTELWDMAEGACGPLAGTA